MTSVLALVVAHNEADVLDATLRGLVEQGCQAAVIDDGSSDGTAEIAASWVGRGVVAVERRPDSGRMVWSELLRLRERLVREHDFDWYVLNDADEFRESPWPGSTLAEGFGRAERMGYNAVNFRVLNFRPTGPGFEPGDDPREKLTAYEPCDPCDAPQVKAFKRPDGPVDVLRSGGHDVGFDGRRVCPVPFILRHYPIRSPEHGRRKVLGERLPRFAAEERAAGWHVQYDELASSGATFAWDPAALVPWDAMAVRAELLAHAADTVLAATATRGVELGGLDLQREALARWAEPRLGRPASAAERRLALAAFERLVGGDAPAVVAADDPGVVDYVLVLLEGLTAQLEAAGEVTQLAAAQGLRRAYALAATPELDGARGFVALVEAEEALARPGLVETFGSAFDARSDATLVFCAPGWSTERLEADLGGLLAALGLDGPAAPDLLAVGEAPARLAARASVVLTEGLPSGELVRVPRVRAGDAPMLKRLAHRAVA